MRTQIYGSTSAPWVDETGVTASNIPLQIALENKSLLHLFDVLNEISTKLATANSNSGNKANYVVTEWLWLPDGGQNYYYAVAQDTVQLPIV